MSIGHYYEVRHFFLSEPSSDITIRAFDGSKRQILGDIDLPVEIGPYTFEVEFQGTSPKHKTFS